METREVDVFIAGAGPVGLVLAYQLRRFGHSVHVVDRDDKEQPDYPMYGRACTLYPGTMELLDRMDLFDDFAQVALTSINTWQWNRGQLVDSKSGLFSDLEKIGMTTSFMPGMMNIRLKYAEDIIRRRLQGLGTTVNAPVEVSSYSVEPECLDDHKVYVVCRRKLDQTTFVVKARYVVGCDGGGSAIRKMAGIPFEGAHNDKISHIVRMDGIFETDMPESRTGVALVETENHGHALWVAFDHGAARMGYTLNRALLEQYGYKLTGDQVIAEAKKAMAPHFTFECKELHWHTVYGVQQYVAARFHDQQRILLAGDAAHTHSSALAQGMNTGVHDATNLAWKLSGTLKGLYTPDVLATYTSERRPVAQRLIRNDKIMATLLSQKTPGSLKEWVSVAHENAPWIVGLSIAYDQNILNQTADGTTPSSSKVRAGERVYDALLQKPSLAGCTVRLNEIQKNNGRFIIMVLAGRPSHCGARLKTLRERVDHSKVSLDSMDLVTIIAGHWYAIDEYLTVPRFGKGYFDPDGSAHAKYGVDETQGALFVVRPDGVLGLATALDDFASVEQYFQRLGLGAAFHGSANGTHPTDAVTETGEFVIDGHFVGKD